jgi:hypothetical protein
MGFLEDLKNGDIKSIILVIFGVLIFHQYWCKSSVQFARSTRRSRCKDNKEPMADVSNDIKEAVKQVYLADVEAIRNLSEIATKINAGTFVFPGNLNVTGTIKASGEISNNSLSLSGLNNSINNVNNSVNNVNSSLSGSINNVNSNLNNQVNSINSQLSQKYDKSGGQINGAVNINGHLTGTNFTMNTGGGWAIHTQGNSGQFVTQNGVYFGAGACHGRGGEFGSCPR